MSYAKQGAVDMSRNIHVVGAGLVGSLASIYLAKKGYQVDLYERQTDIRQHTKAAGRSINLAVSARGFKALAEVGLRQQVLEMAIPMKGRMLHDLDGKTQFVPYGQKEHEVIHSVSRTDLNRLLLSKAESFANVKLHFQKKCLGFVSQTNTLQFLDLSSQQMQHLKADLVIGTDGSSSALRQALKELKHFEMSEQVLEHGYKELVIPAGKHGEFQLEKQALHIWPRKSFMLIALPNLDGSFTVTFFLAHQGENSFASLNSEELVQGFFTRYFSDALALMPQLLHDFFQNPTGTMTTIKSQAWGYEDKLLLLGDAAHAIVPFFGQGMNCGFEDCSTLGDLLDREDAPDWLSFIKTMEQKRKPNADAIADMALENFIEMRDTVSDPKFQMKKQLGFELEKRFPSQFIPRYAMVVFHPEISYAQARERSIRQENWLEELCQNYTSLDQLDWNSSSFNQDLEKKMKEMHR